MVLGGASRAAGASCIAIAKRDAWDIWAFPSARDGRGRAPSSHMGARPPRHFRARLASSPLPLREGPDDIALRESPSNRASIDDGERPDAPVGHEAHHLR